MKKLWVVAGLLLLVVLLTFVSCAGVTKKSVESSTLPVSAPTPTPTPRPAPMPPRASMTPAWEEVSKGGAAGDLMSATAERMIVRSGDMSLVVEAVVAARDEIARLVVRLDGYVVSSWIAGEGKEMRGSISIRVPDEKFEPALAELRSLANRVDSESTSSQDVTEEYVDLEARLKNAEATENQYLALLDKAKDVVDILRVYDYLTRVRAEIEQIKGRMKYLERTSSMSLITVRLQPFISTKPLVPVSWQALEALKSAIRGMVIFGQWLVTIAIWLLLLIPVWGTILGVIYWRRYQRRKIQ